MPTLAHQLRIDQEVQAFRAHLAQRLHTPPPDDPPPNDVQTVMAYIHQHLTGERLTVQAALASCQVTSHAFQARFRQHTGLTVWGYIEAQRMKLACRLLQIPGLQITAVAFELGYLHPGTFTRAFRRTYRCTPGTYRRRLLAGQENVLRDAFLGEYGKHVGEPSLRYRVDISAGRAGMLGR